MFKTKILWVRLIGINFGNGRLLVDSESVFDWPPNSENGRFGMFRRPAKPSASKGRRFGRLWRDLVFIWEPLKTRRICLCCYGNRARANFPAWRHGQHSIWAAHETWFKHASIRKDIMTQTLWWHWTVTRRPDVMQLRYIRTVSERSCDCDFSVSGFFEQLE